MVDHALLLAVPLVGKQFNIKREQGCHALVGNSHLEKAGPLLRSPAYIQIKSSVSHNKNWTHLATKNNLLILELARLRARECARLRARRLWNFVANCC